MSEEHRYKVIEGTPPEPPALREPEAVSADGTIQGVDEMNRKLDLILQALGIKEEL